MDYVSARISLRVPHGKGNGVVNGELLILPLIKESSYLICVVKEDFFSQSGVP